MGFLAALLTAAGPLLAERSAAGRAKPDAPAPATAEDPMFLEIPVVEAATLHTQTLQEAPASVSVISAAEIRKHGYRTLGEAIASVRGFYFTNDRTYDYSGVRGLSIPGDYNSRFLVMLNSHPLTENIYNSNNFFGQDFGLDMDLVERIEIIRGPSSALFGSNGMLATINVITRSPVDHPLARASVEVGSFGEKKSIVSSSFDLGRGANLLISASVFNFGGRSLFYPEYASPETNDGIAERVDAQKGYHTFANLTWGRWNFTGYFNARRMTSPVFGGSTIFNSQGQFAQDSRNFAGLSYTRDLEDNARIRWQMHYDQYRYGDRYDYPIEEGGIQDNGSLNWGDWINSVFTYSRPIQGLGALTLGAQGLFEVRNLQVNFDRAPEPFEYVRVSAPDRIGALFAQQEWSLSRKLKAYLGLRFDSSKLYGNFASPRLALVYQPSDRTVYKAVYGRPFRNPSAYERFYDDGFYAHANPLLTRETAQAFEVSAERKLSPAITGLVNAFHYEISNVIQSALTPEELYIYDNAGARRSTGVEFELQGRLRQSVEILGSYVAQKAVDRNSGAHLPNAPSHIGKARVAVPLVRNRVHLSSGLLYLSERITTQGATVRPVALADVTVSTQRLFRDYDLVCGIRNTLNWQYDHPVDLTMDSIRANGRTFFVKLIWQFRE